MKRTATILFSVAPALLWLAFTVLRSVEGKKNLGWHMLPVDAAKELAVIAKGSVGHFPGYLAAGFFGVIGLVIFLAYGLGVSWALKKTSPALAFASSLSFVALIEGWALFIIIPTLVVPTG